MDGNVAYLSVEGQVSGRGWCMVGVKLYNQLFTRNPNFFFFNSFFFVKYADGVVWLLCSTDATHRSSSSFGSFLLMTASSLFVNI